MKFFFGNMIANMKENFGKYLYSITTIFVLELILILV